LSDDGLPDEGVELRLGDLRFRAPVFEELRGEEVIRSFDLREWSAAIGVGRRWKLALPSLMLAFTVVGFAAAWGGGWWFVFGPLALTITVMTALLLRQTTWLVIYRGEGDRRESWAFQYKLGQTRREETVKFIGTVLGSAKDPPPEIPVFELHF
jgi:hypothetical protein